VTAASLDDDDIALATRLTEEGRWTESQGVCHRILDRTPDHPLAFHLLGVIAYRIERWEIAANLFRKSVALRPHADVQRNLGMTLEKMGRLSEAVAAYQESLAIEPASAESLNALGYAHAGLGEVDAAVRSFERALALKPALRFAIENLLLFSPISEWVGRCDAGLAASGLAPLDRYLLAIHRAVAAWSQGRYQELAQFLDLAAPLRPGEQAGRHADAMQALDCFLARLGAYRNANPHAFHAAAAKTVYAIGDSHILSYANTMLELGGVAHRVCASWLAIDQPWTVRDATPSRFATAFRHIVGALPRGALVLCSCGDIYCRVGSGIMAFVQATGRDLEALIADEVERYVTSVIRMAEARELQLLFLGTPAPHPAAGGSALSSGERLLHATIVASFNRHLRRVAGQAGRAFVDLHGATVGPDGFARGGLHMDQVHLNPYALGRAPILVFGTRI